jgi:iron(III) transport system substrate-binding protein
MRSRNCLRKPALALLWGFAVQVCSGAPAMAGDQTSGAVDARIHLNVAATTDIPEVAELIAEFMKRNPDLLVQYSKVLSGDLFDRVTRPAKDSSIDVLWSSAMDLQIKLANDGYAAEYHSAESGQLPPWAKWKDLVYVVTTEPVVFIYNKRLLHDGMAPRDHADLLRLLTENPSIFRGKIATYDPETSGTGLLCITQDVRFTQETWKLAGAMGHAGVKLYSSALPMIDRVAAGDLVFAYNIPGSYALERAKRDSDLGVIFPSDYTLMLSRPVLIPRATAHLQAAERFVDFLLSPTGQELLAKHSLASVRSDAAPAYPEADKALRPIPLGIDLLTYLDQAKRRRFLKDWKEALQK